MRHPATRSELEQDVQEAWEALRYWEARHDQLSLYRRAARREAAALAASWRGRLAQAERAAYGPPAWEPLAQALRLDRLPARVARVRRRVKRAVIVGVASLAVFMGVSAAAVAVIVERVLGG